MEIREEYNGMKIGDLITTCTKGFWELTVIEVNRVTEYMIKYDSRYKNKNIGDEIEPFFHYKKICDSKGNFPKTPEEDYCVAQFCKPAKEELEKILAISKKLETIYNNWNGK